MKAAGEFLLGAVIGLGVGGLIIWGIVELGDYIVRVTQ